MRKIIICLFTFIFGISTSWISASDLSLAADQALDIPVHKLNELLKSSGGATINQTLDQAFATERMDILEKCFESPEAARLFLMNIKEKPNNGFKDKIVLMMLRSESAFWPAYQDPNQLSQDGSQRFNNYYLNEPFVGVFKKYFNGEELTKEMMERHTERLKLADKIELAMNNRLEELEIKDHVKSKPEVEDEDSSFRYIWVCIIVGLAVIGIFLRLFYRRKASH